MRSRVRGLARCCAGALALAGCGGGGSSSPAPAPAPAGGGLVTSFGTGGVVLSNPSGSDDQPTVVVTDGTNVWVVGTDRSSGATDARWRVECYSLATGAPVNTFGTSGVVTSDPSTRDDEPNHAAIVGTSLFIVGKDGQIGAGDAQWRVEKRSLSTGALDTSFNTTGVLVTNPSTLDDEIEAVVVDSTHLYLVGYDYPSAGDWQWRVEKRSLSTGALDTNFNTIGVITSNPSSGDDEATHAVLLGGNLYVIGYDESVGLGDPQWRLEKRSASTGGPDSTFGGGSGAVAVNPSSSTDQPVLIATDGTDLFIGGLTLAAAGDFAGRIEKRDTTNGALVTGFGTSGVLTVNFSTNAGLEFAAVFFDGGFLYAGGPDPTPGTGNAQWRLDRRSPATGALDGNFGSGGVLTVNPSSANDEPGWVVFTASEFVVAGTDRSLGASNGQWRVQKHSK